MVKDKLVDGKKLLVGLITMIKDAGSKFDDYSISPKIRQTLLHWSYQLVKSNLLWFFSLATLYNIKMREKILKFDSIVVNKKEFHKSKQPIDLDVLSYLK